MCQHKGFPILDVNSTNRQRILDQIALLPPVTGSRSNCLEKCKLVKMHSSGVYYTSLIGEAEAEAEARVEILNKRRTFKEMGGTLVSIIKVWLR